MITLNACRKLRRIRPGLHPLVFAGLLFVTGGSALHAQQQADSPAIGTSARKELLDAARTSVQTQLHKSVRFAVKQLRQADGWAFLHAALLDADNRPLSYAGTAYAAADRHGLKSGSYDALLRLEHGHWTVRVDRIGATDVPWTNWGRDYGAPATLFADDASH